MEFSALHGRDFALLIVPFIYFTHDLVKPSYGEGEDGEHVTFT